MPDLDYEQEQKLLHQFASQAMAALIIRDKVRMGTGEPPETKQVAEKAFAFARAMLRAARRHFIN